MFTYLIIAFVLFWFTGIYGLALACVLVGVGLPSVSLGRCYGLL